MLRARRRWRRYGPGEFGNLWFGDFLQQPQDDVFAGHPFGLRLKVRADAVSQHRHRDFADVGDTDGEAAIHGGQGLAAIFERAA